MLPPVDGRENSPVMDSMNSNQQEGEDEESFDLDTGIWDDVIALINADSPGDLPQESSVEKNDSAKQMGMASEHSNSDQGMSNHQPGKRQKKVKKKQWGEERADRYKWKHVEVKDARDKLAAGTGKEVRSPTAYPFEAIMPKTIGSIFEAVLKRDPHEAEYIQSVQNLVRALERVIPKKPHYINVMERLLEPERMILFRVPWIDDRGETHVNRGFRVQFNQTVGPFRGGIRFHPSMNLSIAKFLALEQTLKNALSPYKLGGAAGGSDFDPKGKSENEIMRFCQSFMNEMYRYLGFDRDLPWEEMGVGTREMGYLFGQYRRLDGHYHRNFSRPRTLWSRCSIRTEATGYGIVLFAHFVLAQKNLDLKGQRCVVSGFGKIARYVLEQLLHVGAIPITVSDSKGYLVDNDGFDDKKIQFLRDIQAQKRSLREYSKTYMRSKYCDAAKPWGERCDIAFPCAFENEINQSDALNLVSSGCQLLVEGSCMPCSAEAVDILRNGNIQIVPAIAAGAGGVVAGEILLHDFNSRCWGPDDFNSKLQEAMKLVYASTKKSAVDFGYDGTPDGLVHGAVISAFLTIAKAMTDQGCV